MIVDMDFIMSDPHYAGPTDRLKKKIKKIYHQTSCRLSSNRGDNEKESVLEIRSNCLPDVFFLVLSIIIL